MPVKRIEAFVRTGDGDFDELWREAFAFQRRRVPAIDELCRRRGLGEGGPAGFRDVPLVPTLAFKRLELAAAEPREVFRSSGTTQPERSVHRHPFPELYRAVIEATFPGALLERPPLPAGSPMLSLVPTRRQAPDSSLAFMVDHVLATWSGEGSATAFGAAGVDVRAARSWLAARQRDRRPALVLATAFALARLLASLERMDLRFRLPAGSRLFETGGFKGRGRELDRGELVAAIDDRLGIPAGQVVREYGMTELTSHFYTRALEGGDPDLFVPPPWTRVRALDPETLAESPPGEAGLLAVFDLANVGSALHLLTEDLGAVEAGGFRLTGRAAGAELRGCSLAAEELEASPGA